MANEDSLVQAVQQVASRLPYWPIVATPEIGCFGRIRWINSEPSEQVWGRIWWSSR